MFLYFTSPTKFRIAEDVRTYTSLSLIFDGGKVNHHWPALMTQNFTHQPFSLLTPSFIIPTFTFPFIAADISSTYYPFIPFSSTHLALLNYLVECKQITYTCMPWTDVTEVEAIPIQLQAVAAA